MVQSFVVYVSMCMCFNCWVVFDHTYFWNYSVVSTTLCNQFLNKSLYRDTKSDFCLLQCIILSFVSAFRCFKVRVAWCFVSSKVHCCPFVVKLIYRWVILKLIVFLWKEPLGFKDTVMQATPQL